MKICMIVPKGLPVPAVKGGAIETLVNDIIDENEKKAKLEITVASLYDKGAEEISKTYQKTNFIYLKNDINYKIKAILIRIMNLFRKDKLNTYNEVILDKIKKTNFDYIVVEDGAFMSFKSYLKYFNKEQMILHFHHNGESDRYTDETFSTYLGVSQFVANTFKKSSTIKDIRVLKNGIKIEKFLQQISEEEKNRIRQKYGLKKEDFVIIFCGRLIPEKGILELVKAVKSIDNKKIKLMIVGSINFGVASTTEYLKILKEEVENSNGQIIQTGYIDNNELYKYYQSTDLGVIPSIWEDAAPLVTIEMMINKLPLIITKSGGAPEYASDETIIIPKDDKIIENLNKNIIDLYKDKAKRAEIAKESYNHAKKYTTEKFYEDFVTIIQSKKWSE